MICWRKGRLSKTNTPFARSLKHSAWSLQGQNPSLNSLSCHCRLLKTSDSFLFHSLSKFPRHHSATTAEASSVSISRTTQKRPDTPCKFAGWAERGSHQQAARVLGWNHHQLRRDLLGGSCGAKDGSCQISVQQVSIPQSSG